MLVKHITGQTCPLVVIENRPISLLHVECEMNTLSKFFYWLWWLSFGLSNNWEQNTKFNGPVPNTSCRIITLLFNLLLVLPPWDQLSKKTYTMAKVFPILKPLQSFSDIWKYIPHNHPEYWKLLIWSGARFKTPSLCIVPYKQHASYSTLISSA